MKEPIQLVDKALSAKDVSRLLGVESTRTLFRYVERHADFPRPRKINERRVFWLESEIMHWLRNRPKTRVETT